MATEIPGEDLSSSEPTASQALKNGSSGESTVSDPSSTSLVSKATGPRTAQGKERSSHNAITHGIFSQAVVVKGESRADFDTLLNALYEDRQPEGATEEIFVNKLAVLWWRLRRVWAAES